MSLAALLAAATTAAAAATPPPHAYRISVHGGFYTERHESIAVMRLREGAGGPFWAAERRKRLTNGARETISLEHQWIDGRTCPQLGAVLAQVDAIPRPRPTKAIPPFHGTRVKVARPLKNGLYDGPSDYMGPVTDWWRAADKALSGCWRADPVVVDGAPIPASLGSAEAELRFTPLPGAW